MFRITPSRQTITRSGPGDLLNSGTYDKIELAVDFGNGRKAVSMVYLRAAAPAADGK